LSGRSIFDCLAMLACSVYCTIPLFWLVVHPFIGGWRKRGRRAYSLILPFWGVFIAATLAMLWHWRSAHLYESWWAWIPAGGLFFTGMSIYRAAFKGFHHSQVSGMDELEPDKHRQQLVTSGIRAWLRHPIYLGHLCEVLGWCIGTGLVALYALAGIAMVTGALMIRMEDDELEERFGESYRAYRGSVPAVLPKVKRCLSMHSRQ
jgi:protein-S-isoprenylcysteine O-methyltransferase Ste14